MSCVVVVEAEAAAMMMVVLGDGDDDGVNDGFFLRGDNLPVWNNGARCSEVSLEEEAVKRMDWNLESSLIDLLCVWLFSYEGNDL